MLESWSGSPSEEDYEERTVQANAQVNLIDLMLCHYEHHWDQVSPPVFRCPACEQLAVSPWAAADNPRAARFVQCSACGCRATGVEVMLGILRGGDLDEEERIGYVVALERLETFIRARADRIKRKLTWGPPFKREE